MKRYAIVYQCGIANVFDVSSVRCKLCQDRPGLNGLGKPCKGCKMFVSKEAAGMLPCTEPKRLLQHAFSPCEWFLRGAVATDKVEFIVRHCDKAGDIANCMDEWEEGAGSMFEDSKSYR